MLKRVACPVGLWPELQWLDVLGDLTTESDFTKKYAYRKSESAAEWVTATGPLP